MPAESPAPSGVAPFAYASLIFRTCMQVAYARAMVSREGRAQHARRADEVQRAPGRTPWGSITRAQIIEAAMTVVKAGGYDQMTVRSLAAELGVSPMSLYRHIRDKDDLLDEVVDRLLANAWRPRCAKEDWRAWMAEAADRLRRLLVSQPAALHVYLRHPVVSPAAIARMEAMMSVLRRAGAEEQAARRGVRGSSHLHHRLCRLGILQGFLGTPGGCHRQPGGRARNLHGARAVRRRASVPA